MTLRSEIAAFTADVPDTYSPRFEPAMGGYNFSGWGMRCRGCGGRLISASYDVGGWKVQHDGDDCGHGAPLPAANVGKGRNGWMLLDPWGSTWAFPFRTRMEAARFACALVMKRGNVPLDWITAAS